MCSFSKYYCVVFALLPVCAFGADGVISNRIVKDLEAVKVGVEGDGVINKADVSRMAFALGRLSQHDSEILNTFTSDEQGYEFILSSGVHCRIDKLDLEAGDWKPRALNVPNSPVSIVTGDRTIPLKLMPCLTP